MEAKTRRMVPAEEHGKVLLNWEFPEHPRYERGAIWYILMVAVGLGLLIYSIISANFPFALIIVMFGIVLYLTAVTEPASLRFAATEDGIRVGRSFYPYKEIKHFWFVYEPPEVKKLYLDFKSALRPRLAINLMEEDPNNVREVLSPYIQEDFTQEDEPFSDMMGRVLKI